MAFKLVPNPTFKAGVGFHVPGQQKNEKITFTFKYRDTEQLAQFQEEIKGKSNEEIVLMIADGWEDIDLEFNEEGLNQLFRYYHSAPERIIQAYYAELIGARLGN